MKIEDNPKRRKLRHLLSYSVSLLMGVTYIIRGIIEKNNNKIILGIFMVILFLYFTLKLFKKASFESTIYYNDIKYIKIISTYLYNYNGNNLFKVSIITKNQRVREIQIEDGRNEISEFRNCIKEYGLKIF
jgi:hypothetical protein